MARVKTRTGVLVRRQGREYVAYCNQCPWEGNRVRVSLGNARNDGIAHDRREHQ